MYLIFSFFSVLFLFEQNIVDKKIISNFSETQHFIIPRGSGDDNQLSVSEIVLSKIMETSSGFDYVKPKVRILGY